MKFVKSFARWQHLIVSTPIHVLLLLLLLLQEKVTKAVRSEDVVADPHLCDCERLIKEQKLLQDALAKV